MEFLNHRFWHTSVVMENDQELRATAAYCDLDLEMNVIMLVDIYTFEIQQAWIEFPGSPGQMGEKLEYLDDLRGIKAYLESGPQLRKCQPKLNEKIARTLINEAVIGVVQAETFLYKERGYTSSAEYSQAWEKFYKGTCRYYSNLDRVMKSWDDYLGSDDRKKDMFDRYKSQQLYRHKDGSYLVTGNLRDSFHQLAVWIEMEAAKMSVIRARGELLRTPDPVCAESSIYLSKLENQILPDLPKKEIAGLLGAGCGCVHLIDLVYGSAETVKAFLDKDNKSKEVAI